MKKTNGTQNKRIYFYANLGDLNKPVYGGGEAGNRRTLEILKSAFDVKPINKYRKSTGRKLMKLLKTSIGMGLNLCKFSSILLFGKRENSIVHIAGFYGVMIYWELTLIIIAKILGYKVVYEMRGGGAEHFYSNGSKLYKLAFSEAIKCCLSILSQGQENIPLIRKISKEINIFYYPNYVNADFLPRSCPPKNFETLNLIYFGRLSRTKHIKLIIEVLALVKEKINIPITLTLIGKFESEDYKREIEALISKYNLISEINIKPSCQHRELTQYLYDKHIYLFPTTEPREGHSNAMTEAMAYGIIPITTNHGFSKSVLDEPSLIVSDLSANGFAEKIIEIVQGEKIDMLSHKMYNRIVEHFSYDRISTSLINYYSTL